MTHLIDKSALVAEIEKIIPSEPYPRTSETLYGAEKYGKREMCFRILDLIDTLEVKEVDLEKELENLIEKEKAFVTDNREVKYYNGDSFNHIYELEFIAKYFFELGLNAAQKGE